MAAEGADAKSFIDKLKRKRHRTLSLDPFDALVSPKLKQMKLSTSQQHDAPYLRHGGKINVSHTIMIDHL